MEFRQCLCSCRLVLLPFGVLRRPPMKKPGKLNRS